MAEKKNIDEKVLAKEIVNAQSEAVGNFIGYIILMAVIGAILYIASLYIAGTFDLSYGWFLFIFLGSVILAVIIVDYFKPNKIRRRIAIKELDEHLKKKNSISDIEKSNLGKKKLKLDEKFWKSLLKKYPDVEWVRNPEELFSMIKDK
jgi:hypothetical protein